MNWIYLALLTACFYALYNIFIKMASGHIHEITGAVILQVVAFVIGGLWLIYLKMKGVPTEVTSKGIGLAVLAGIFVGLAEIFSFLVFSKGVPASAGIPVIIGGSVLIAAAIGFLWLRETLTLSNLLGLALIVAGIWLLSRKPGI
ncbi:MAG TPA: EamA family transporter [Chitinophagaceae bacterium]|jgi:transporter family protein|nr:EamA family transporter [Chitinophagaceae bacterium]